jgi:hypothetical protein
MGIFTRRSPFAPVWALRDFERKHETPSGLGRRFCVNDGAGRYGSLWRSHRQSSGNIHPFFGRVPFTVPGNGTPGGSKWEKLNSSQNAAGMGR